MIQTTSTAGTSTYTYDYMGNRVHQNQGGNVTNYLWDEGSRFRDVIYEYDNLGDMINSYTLVNDMILAQTNSIETLYLLPDRLGSTRAVTDVSGIVTDTVDYTAFGELVGDSSSLATNYLFAGQQYDSNTDFYSMRARYYDASLGRFLSQDTYPYDFDNPVELNRYLYTANNPVNWTDPSGMGLFSRASLEKMGTMVRNSLVSVGRTFGNNLVQGFIGGGLGYVFAQWLLMGLEEVDGDFNQWGIGVSRVDINRIISLVPTFDFWWNGLIGMAIAAKPIGSFDELFGGLASANILYAILTSMYEFGENLFTFELRGTYNFQQGIAEQSLEFLSDTLVGVVAAAAAAGFEIAIDGVLGNAPAVVKAFFGIASNTLVAGLSTYADNLIDPPCTRTICEND